MKLSENSKRNLVKALNSLAVLMIVGCVFYMASSTDSTTTVASEGRGGKFLNTENVDVLPTAANKNRKLSKNGKGSSYYDDVACIPIYPTPGPSPTPAPTKGKGKGMDRRQLMSSKGSKGKGSSSEAPSFFCSDAPSTAPTLSSAPSPGPTPSPPTPGPTPLPPTPGPTPFPPTPGPTCGKGKGKGKGSSLFSECTGKSGKGI
mmetsp:Transcript_25099/g.47670  ORF Transcript_25099/g.47670 Transcript_25099/m.47670 type:complete len:203 (-) Transcript_25099:142-750(-)|eukprot:scaffold20880_cov174-Amphora_coffeaeformis.AAC.10